MIILPGWAPRSNEAGRRESISWKHASALTYVNNRVARRSSNNLCWRLIEKRAMLLLDVRFVQTIDLLRSRVALEAEILVCLPTVSQHV